MEGSAAAAPAAASGDGQATQGDAAQGQDGGQSDLTATLSQIAQGQEEMRQFLQSQPWQPEPAPPEPEQPPEADLSFLDPESPQYDPNTAAQQLQQLIQQEAATQAQQLVQQHVAPLQEAQEEMVRSRAADALVAEFPDLQKPEVAQQVVDQSVKMAEMLGQPELAKNPEFWRVNMMAMRYMELQQKQKGDESSQAATLEGAGGASPGAQQGESAADRIVNAGRTTKVLPFP